MNRLNKLLLPLAAMILFAQYAGAEHLLIPVRLYADHGSADDIDVRIACESKTSVIKGRKRMKLTLDFNKSYLITFSGNGYISKQVEINTAVPSALRSYIEPYAIGVKLFRQNEANMVAFNQPVARIIYKTAESRFDYEVDYTKSILSSMDTGDDEVADAPEDSEGSEADNRSKSESHAASQNMQPVQQARFSQSFHASPKSGTATTADLPVISKESFSAADENYLPRHFNGHDLHPQSSAASGQDVSPEKVEAVSQRQCFSTITAEVNRIITQTEVRLNGVSVVYKKIDYAWGAVYYFRENTSISRDVYLWSTTL
jgi:hypothetical protein